ncbi:SDR family oxidoreductase [Limoniibacter endophyticus]|nr:SDR family oxidoreductase [Limoniibacter endophyticus]
MRKIVFLGAGYSARTYARLYGGGHRLIGTTRDEARFELLEQAGIAPLVFDGRTLSGELRSALEEATDLVISASPDEQGDPVLRLIAELALPKLQWIGYLSTIGVYGDFDGEWVSEESEPRSPAQRGQWRLLAERSWQAFGNMRGASCAVLRLGGIYGPGRNSFVKLAEAKAHRIVKPGQVFNRTHVADIAGALDFLMQKRESGIFNVVDDEPSPPQDVVAFAADLMDVEAPEEIAFDVAGLSPAARKFYGENRRVSNAKLRGLGYMFRYPNFRIALLRLWQDDEWHARW